ncbi:MAG: general secretion pathway protein GspI [Bdellovibrionaceae bacterium]|nr:general secretion pathway protein GspI [Pseudobdellovibrionaceae bacterium]
MRSNKGFSLIEVMVAVSILAGGLVALNLAWNNNFLRLRKSKRHNDVSFLLERKMAEIELQFKDTALSSIDEKLEGDFGKDYPKYRWTFESREFVMPDLKILLAAGEDGETQNDAFNQVSERMTEFLSKSVKEGKVTLFVKVGKDKEAKYSVVTYFVDYKQNLSL